MSKKDTPLTTLQRIIRNTNTKNTLTKTKVLEQQEYNNLIKYIADNITTNSTINYTEQIYKTKYETKTKLHYYITDNKGKILNISHILYLIYKPYIPYIKLNVKHNYIIGNIHTSAELYARLSNYIYHTNKTVLHIHNLIPLTE